MSAAATPGPASPSWDPAKYLEFADFRNRPFFDLVSRVGAASPHRVVDLGCGPGNLTASLTDRWPQAEVMGVDSSAAMIEAARRDSGSAQRKLSFEHEDIVSWCAGPGLEASDVVISNAALQWVPEHRELLPEWLRRLRPGGWFAFQVPGNFGGVSHVLMRQLADSAQWRDRLAGVLRADPVAVPEQYLEIFLDAGLRADAWETTYLQMLPGRNAVLNWVRGTALRPLRDALEAAEAKQFEAEYAALLAEAYPPRAQGTLFPFRRLFIVGQKPA